MLLLIFTLFLQWLTAVFWSVMLTESLLQLILLSLRVVHLLLLLLLLNFKCSWSRIFSSPHRPSTPKLSPLPCCLINDVTSANASRDADVNVNSLSFNRLIDSIAMVVMVCDDVGDWCPANSLVADKLPLIELLDVAWLSIGISTWTLFVVWSCRNSIGGLSYIDGEENEIKSISKSRTKALLSL